MAIRVIETITCDKCGKVIENEHQDVRFNWQGKFYSIDLCDQHYDEVDRAMRKVIELAEQVKVKEREFIRLKRLAAIDAHRLRKETT